MAIFPFFSHHKACCGGDRAAGGTSSAKDHGSLSVTFFSLPQSGTSLILQLLSAFLQKATNEKSHGNAPLPVLALKFNPE
jgi:hypothetical protein